MERLLAEEKQRCQALEKRLQLREDSHASQEEQHKMHGKEMHVLKQEVRIQKSDQKLFKTRCTIQISNKLFTCCTKAGVNQCVNVYKSLRHKCQMSLVSKVKREVMI